MDDEKFNRLCEDVKNQLAEEPISPSDLFDVLKEKYSYSTTDIRHAIWHLHDEGNLEITMDWKFKSARPYRFEFV